MSDRPIVKKAPGTRADASPERKASVVPVPLERCVYTGTQPRPHRERAALPRTGARVVSAWLVARPTDRGVVPSRQPRATVARQRRRPRPHDRRILHSKHCYHARGKAQRQGCLGDGMSPSRASICRYCPIDIHHDHGTHPGLLRGDRLAYLPCDSCALGA